MASKKELMDQLRAANDRANYYEDMLNSQSKRFQLSKAASRARIEELEDNFADQFNRRLRFECLLEAESRDRRDAESMLADQVNANAALTDLNDKLSNTVEELSRKLSAIDLIVKAK